jgi:putative phage-type endonuclease
MIRSINIYKNSIIKLKEIVALYNNWLQLPSDYTQLQIWIESAHEIAEPYELNDIEQSYLDVIIDMYEEQFTQLIRHNGQSDENIPTKEYLDKLVSRNQTEQRTTEWYAQMTTILSASELGNLFASPRTRAKLVMAKTQPYIPRNSPLAVPSTLMSAFDWGIRFEPVVKQIYEYKYNVHVKELGRLVHPIDPRCSASPDGLVYHCPNNKKTGRLIEIKCPVTREIDGQIPKDYYAQMQMQLQVTGLHKCDYIEAQFASQYNTSYIKYGPGLYNGNIALIRYNIPKNDQEYYYVYSPINDIEWRPSVPDGDDIIEIIPWCLMQWSEQVVMRNEEWWKSLQPVIENFWNDVEKAKNGEFVVPESTRKIKPKEEKCIIIFNKIE